MKTLLALVLAVAGCTGDDGQEFPINTPTIAPGTTSPAASILTGRVCVLVDAQQLTVCSVTEGGGLVITSGTKTTITNPDGTFTIVTNPDRVLVVTGTNIVTSTTVLPSVQDTATANALLLPVMSNVLFGNLVLATGINLTQGTGSVLSSVITRGGTPLANITAISTPSPAFGPFFDSTQPAPWTLDATGARGIVFFPGISAGPVNLTFRDLSTSGETTVGGVQVVNGGLTFTEAVLP